LNIRWCGAQSRDAVRRVSGFAQFHPDLQEAQGRLSEPASIDKAELIHTDSGGMAKRAAEISPLDWRA